jgi:hypothetical protein
MIVIVKINMVDKNNHFLKSKHEVAAQNKGEIVFNILRTTEQKAVEMKEKSDNSTLHRKYESERR